MTLSRNMVILMAEDDEDDRILAQDALDECGEVTELLFVDDGVQLLDYLHGAEESGNRRPDLILLDLNMPRLDGREALRRIKSDPTLRYTPIVVLTTSQAREDIWSAYDEGANSYVTKPVSYEGLVDVMKSLRSYWAETVQLPVVTTT